MTPSQVYALLTCFRFVGSVRYSQQVVVPCPVSILMIENKPLLSHRLARGGGETKRRRESYYKRLCKEEEWNVQIVRDGKVAAEAARPFCFSVCKNKKNKRTRRRELTFLALQVAAEMLVSYTSLNGYVHTQCVCVRTVSEKWLGGELCLFSLSVSLSLSQQSPKIK